ncbi:hypothetical protein, partial [Actinomyces denticolens]|uniref:hypothetical protein n=1 Tax=Actinomyces denticolens TaxID=52767 RepID=UPI00196AFF66
VGVEVTGLVEVGDPDGDVVEVRHDHSLSDESDAVKDQTIILSTTAFLSHFDGLATRLAVDLHDRGAYDHRH